MSTLWIDRAWRFYIFEHYRGPEYIIPYDKPELSAYKDWYDHVFSLESVQKTLPDKDRYLHHIGKYAGKRVVQYFSSETHIVDISKGDHLIGIFSLLLSLLMLSDAR